MAIEYKEVPFDVRVTGKLKVNAAIYSMLDVGYGSTYREAMYSRPYKQAIAMIKSRRRAPEYDEGAKSQRKGHSLDERYAKELLNGQ
jgi:hypothetical protein